MERLLKIINSFTSGVIYYFPVAIILSTVACDGSKGGSLPAVPPPDAPVIKSVIAGDSKVSITWENKSDLKYNLYVSLNDAPNIPVMKNLSGSSYTDNAAINDKTHSYFLTAIGSGGESKFSAKSTIVTPYARVNMFSTSFHTCIIRDGGNNDNSGSVWCWGNNSKGQLGNGMTSRSEKPTQEVTKATDWVQVVSGYEHTCAIKLSGRLYCWGSNLNGQLGINFKPVSNQLSTIVISTPTEVIVDARANQQPADWINIALGENHTCGIRNKSNNIKGELWCWGNNEFGQLGNNKSGLTSNQFIPNLVLANVNNTQSSYMDWSEVSLGNSHTCGIRKDILVVFVKIV